MTILSNLSVLLFSAAVFLPVPGVSEDSDGSIVAWRWNDNGQCNVPVSWYPGIEYMIHVEDDQGYSGWSDEFTVAPPVPIVGDESTGTCNYALHDAAPNPSYGMARVAFEIPVIENVCMTVYDISGRAVTELMYSALAPGTHEAIISDLHAGLYIVRMQAGGFSDYGRMIVIR